MGGDIAPAVVPLIVGLLSAAVACGRWQLVPNFGSSRPSSGAEAARSATAVKAAEA